jgi:FkbM family methyltransferase
MTPRQPVGRNRTVPRKSAALAEPDVASGSAGSETSSAGKAKTVRQSTGASKRPRYKAGALNDFPTRLPNQQFEVIFDVGANVGQSALEFAAAYPDAAVWAFEPVPASYDALVKAVTALGNVTAIPDAMGALASTGLIRSSGTSPGNKLVSGGTQGPGLDPVSIITGDEFCATNDIAHVDFLKIDTVGHDLDVLLGFHHMLGDNAIDVLQVEAGTYIENRRQVPLERLRGFLEPLGYHLFGIYGQARGFEGLPVLSRVDAVFASTPALEHNVFAA